MLDVGYYEQTYGDTHDYAHTYFNKHDHGDLDYATCQKGLCSLGITAIQILHDANVHAIDKYTYLHVIYKTVAAPHVYRVITIQTGTGWIASAHTSWQKRNRVYKNKRPLGLIAPPLIISFMAT